MENVNAAFEASGGDITDDYIIERYANVIPEMGPHLKGDPKLNDLVFAYENKRVRAYLLDKYIAEGATTEDAKKRSDKEADILLAEALSSYDTLKKSRKNA